MVVVHLRQLAIVDAADIIRRDPLAPAPILQVLRRSLGRRSRRIADENESCPDTRVGESRAKLRNTRAEAADHRIGIRTFEREHDGVLG